MNRREFLRRLGGYTAAGIAGLYLPGRSRLFAQEGRPANWVPDLVAVKGGPADRLFDRGISALGGMGAFVSRGDTVAVKPNMSWNVDPERGATTDPALVGRIVEHCLEAGASRVYVFDHTLDSWRGAYERSGIKGAVEEHGGTIVPANSTRYYQKSDIAGADTLRSTSVHELVLEADVFINVPVLKHHGSTRITAAMKNLMGVVWDRGWYHSHGLNQCIADFPLLRAPDLNIVDAYRVMMSGGPRGSSYAFESTVMEMQILSTDIVAADTAAAKTWGIEPERVRHIPLAVEHGLGTDDLSSLDIERILL